MKKLSILVFAAPMVLASCGGSKPATPAFDPSTYAGYSCDLNANGTIEDNEKNLTWAKSFDAIIGDIKKESNNDLRFKKMHAAEDLLMDTGCLAPIYYYTDAFMKKEALKGYYGQPLGIKFFEEATYGESGTFTVCIASKPDTIDPALNSSVDGGTMGSALFQGLKRWSHEGEYGSANYKAVVVDGDIKSETKVVHDDGTVTYTYVLKDNLKWSDGTSYNANDYVRSWKRAVSPDTGGDYAYLYEIVAGGEEAEGDASKLDQLAMKAIDANTIEVTLVSDAAYWNQLLAFPTFFPVPASADVGGEWCAMGKTPVSNGAMKVSSYTESGLTMVKNPNYVDASRVKADSVTYAFSEDADAMLRSYKAGEWVFIDDVPVEEMKNLERDYPKEFFNPGQLGTYYACFNIRDRSFDAVLDTETKRQDFRKALSLLIDRNYIIDDVAQNGATPADGFVSAGLTQPNGADWTASRKKYSDVSAAAQAANEAKAVAAIKALGYSYDEASKKFSGIPTIKYLYNTGSGHKAIAEAIQQCFAKYGISMKLENQEWATFLNTRKSGDYSVARNGWLCDYDDPISMLDMWVSNSGNNDVGFGKKPL